MAMQVYRSVVDAGSFAQAAKMLRLSAASVSRHVADLERHLRVTLLRRSSRALLVTQVGTTYYAHCCEILDRLEEVEGLAAQTKAEARGHLGISMPAGFGVHYVAPLLPRFMERYPEIEIDVWCSDDFVDFSESGIDVAIRITREPESNLIAKEIAPVRCVVVASPEYLAQRGVPETPDDLRDHACMAYAHTRYGANWVFFRDAEEMTVPVRYRFRSNCGGVLRQACLAGKGIAIEPVFMVDDDLRSGRLVELLPDYRLYAYRCYAVYPQDGRNSVRTSLFVDFLRAELPALLPD